MLHGVPWLGDAYVHVYACNMYAHYTCSQLRAVASAVCVVGRGGRGACQASARAVTPSLELSRPRRPSRSYRSTVKRMRGSNGLLGCATAAMTVHVRSGE